MPMYVKIGDGSAIKGEVTESKHKDWIAIDTLSISNAMSRGAMVGGAKLDDRTKGHPTFQEIKITRSYDKASPLLFNESCSNTTAPVEIHFMEASIDPDKEPNVYLKIRLRDVLISSYSLDGGGAGPVETIGLNFTAISLDYQVYKDTDEPDGAPIRGYYQIKENQVEKWN